MSKAVYCLNIKIPSTHEIDALNYAGQYEYLVDALPSDTWSSGVGEGHWVKLYSRDESEITRINREMAKAGSDLEWTVSIPDPDPNEIALTDEQVERLLPLFHAE